MKQWSWYWNRRDGISLTIMFRPFHVIWMRVRKPGIQTDECGRCLDCGVLIDDGCDCRVDQHE